MIRKLVRTTALFASICSVFIMGYVSYLQGALPDEFYVTDTGNFSLSQYEQIRPETNTPTELAAGVGKNASKSVELKLLGVFPVKNTYLHQTDEQYVVPCGSPFGLKLLTDGVVVVGLNPVEGETGVSYPAQAAGIQKGDVIHSVAGFPVSSYKELSARIAESKGEPVEILFSRGEEKETVRVKPVKSAATGQYQCGIWVRDSSAGIGTVTFYDPVTGVFGGLGHAVCDVDTGEPLPLASGEVVPVSILDVIKGTAGSPGELQGTFLSRSPSGTLAGNTEAGIYGTMESCPVVREAIPVCLRQNVKPGSAQIYATVSGTEPKLYDITIEKVNLSGNTPTKNMVVRVTDPRLLSETGGIVQGMSGSPILQNGKLVGAVTHVFVNDPERGYGIFAENMLDAAKEVNALRLAS